MLWAFGFQDSGCGDVGCWYSGLLDLGFKASPPEFDSVVRYAKLHACRGCLNKGKGCGLSAGQLRM